jgi:DNA polymerase-3 subunit alpha
MVEEATKATVATGADAFVHLHTHSEFSLLDGAARIPELVARAAALGQPAVAVTDHGVLYGAVDLYTEAIAAGVKPILGCEVYMAPRSHRDKEGRADRDPNHLVLLARDATGYANLVALSTIAHLEGYYYRPRIDKELLAAHSEGLICLSGCVGGELPQAILSGDLDAAERVARQHQEIFGPDGYFLEIQDHGMTEETAVREGLLEIARRTGLPLICTNDSHYIDAADAEAHDILLCLQTGSRRDDEKRLRFHGPQFYVASGEEMRRRFAAYGEAAANTVAVAARCDWKLELGQHHLPAYSPIPEGLDADSYLAELCEQGLAERYGGDPSREARERLAMELDVIRQTGFSAYFLIVWDLIRAARCDGVVVGPGRGSAAGSLVAYVLRITNVDPLRYGLIFERFLNLERREMPDIDIDFDDRRRDRVIQYVTGKYGQDRVAQIITFGTMAARAAIRDVGRVLDVPLPDVDRLAKLVPASIGITLDRALAEARDLRDLYDNEPWARSVIDRPPPRGHLPQRLDPRRGCRHRRRAARQHRPPGPRHLGQRGRGHPVRHEGREPDRPAQDRLPGALQPHRDPGGGREHREGTGGADGHRRHPPRRPPHLRAARQGGHPRGLPARGDLRQADPHRHAAALARRPGGCQRAQPSRSHRGRGRRPLHPAQAR